MGSKIKNHTFYTDHIKIKSEIEALQSEIKEFDRVTDGNIHLDKHGREYSLFQGQNKFTKLFEGVINFFIRVYKEGFNQDRALKRVIDYQQNILDSMAKRVHTCVETMHRVYRNFPQDAVTHEIYSAKGIIKNLIEPLNNLLIHNDLNQELFKKNFDELDDFHDFVLTELAMR